MKILLATGIYPPDAGGPATFTRAFARAALSSEHEVQVVAYGEKDGIEHVDGYPVERIGRNRNILARYWKFADTVRRRARLVDVVYLQGPVSEGLPGTIGAMLAGKSTVMKVVGDYAWEMYQGTGNGEREAGNRAEPVSHVCREGMGRAGRTHSRHLQCGRTAALFDDATQHRG